MASRTQQERSQLRAVILRHMYPDWACLPEMYSLHVPTYLLRSAADPRSAAFRLALLGDLGLRVSRLTVVQALGGETPGPGDLSRAYTLYSRMFRPSAQHTFAQCLALRAVDQMTDLVVHRGRVGEVLLGLQAGELAGVGEEPARAASSPTP